MFNKVSDNWKEYTESSNNAEMDNSCNFKATYGYEYSYAEKLKEKLIEKYRGLKLEDVIEKENLEIKKDWLLILSSADIEFNVDIEQLKNSYKFPLLKNLQLVYGIGNLTEKRLREMGFETIKDLVNHPRFADKAAEILKLTEEKNIAELFHLIRNRTSKSHSLILHLPLLNNLENFTFLDIETLGLFARPIILIGTAKISEGRVYFKQYFIKNIKEEKTMIENFIKELNKNSILVTYNGEAFDVPYIEDRLNYFKLGKVIDLPDLNLLIFTRKKWRGILPNCKLVTIERHILGISREEDVPSALVPEFYETYLRTNNIGPVIPIIEHNREDILTLIKIYFTLCKEL